MGPTRKQTTPPKAGSPVRRTRKKAAAAAAPEVESAAAEIRIEPTATRPAAAVAPPATVAASRNPPNRKPTREQIAHRAFEIYLARGGTDGQDLEDWLRAERELAASSASR